MFSKGTKRKFSDAGEETADEHLPGLKVAPSYSLQRQCLLDMSLIKLQLCHMLVEPNLCRSVLIANTVRQIQEEMTQDGSWQAMAEALAAGPSQTERLEATEVLCRPSARGQAEETKVFTAEGFQGCHSEEEEEEEEEEVVVDDSLCDSPDEEDLKEACEEEEEEERGCGSESGGEDEEQLAEDSKTTEQVFGTFEIKNPVPSPDPPLEELFSDVDTYCDLDTMLTGMQSAPKMGPYDLLESLSSHGPSPSCRPDLNELDHIMEIIVGS